MSIVTRPGHTRQPQCASRIAPADGGFGLCRDLVFAWLPHSPVDLVRGLHGTRSGSTRVYTRYGVANAYSGANAGDDFGTTRVIPGGTSTYSVLVVGVWASTGFGSMFAQRLGSGPFSQVSFLYGYDAGLFSNPGCITIFEFDGVLKASAGTENTVADNQVHVVLGLRNGAASNGKIYVDGRDATYVTGGDSGTTDNSSQKIRIGNSADYDGTDFEAELGVQLVAVWTRALSDFEAKSVTRNPWQIFVPLPRRLWAPSTEVIADTVRPQVHISRAAVTRASRW